MAIEEQRSQNEPSTRGKTRPAGTEMVDRLQCGQEDDDKECSGDKRLENQIMPASQPARSPIVVVPGEPDGLLPGEHLDVRVDVNELLGNGDEWLATPNTNYGGRCPLELIGTPDEILLRNTLRSVIYSGMA